MEIAYPPVGVWVAFLGFASKTSLNDRWVVCFVPDGFGDFDFAAFKLKLILKKKPPQFGVAFA